MKIKERLRNSSKLKEAEEILQLNTTRDVTWILLLSLTLLGQLAKLEWTLRIG